MSDHTAYLISVWDADEYGIQDSPIVGPFPDAATAVKFRDDHRMGEESADGRGGYSYCHVVAEETCDQSPDEYHAEWLATYADEDETP